MAIFLLGSSHIRATRARQAMALLKDPVSAHLEVEPRKRGRRKVPPTWRTPGKGHRERDTPVRETKGKAIGIHREFLGAASKGNEVQYRRALELFTEPTMCFDSDHNYIGS